MRYLSLLFLILFVSCTTKNLAGFNADNISKSIARNIKYPEDAISQNLSALIIVKIDFNKNGDIHSVSTLNSEVSKFSQEAISAVERTDKSLFRGINKIPLLIPVYFLHADTDKVVQINYLQDFRPENFKYPFKCTFFKPIIIVSRSNNITR